MTKAKVKPGWEVFWPPAGTVEEKKKQKLYVSGDVIEFDEKGPHPPADAVEILSEPEPEPDAKGGGDQDDDKIAPNVSKPKKKAGKK